MKNLAIFILILICGCAPPENNGVINADVYVIKLISSDGIERQREVISFSEPQVYTNHNGTTYLKDYQNEKEWYWEREAVPAGWLVESVEKK